MKTKIWIEIEGAPINTALDEFCRLRRAVAGEGVEVVFKQGKFFMESSDPKETPEEVYRKYMKERARDLRERFSDHGS